MTLIPVQSKIAIGLAVASLLLSGFVAYTTGTDKDHQRIAVVETQQKSDGDRLGRIENKVDQIYILLLK